MKIGIIGGGRVGRCLAEYVQERGHLVGVTAADPAHRQQLAARFRVPALANAELWQQAQLVLLTVPDRKISTVAQELALLPAGAAQVVLHCSGSLGLEPLAPLAAQGLHTGSLHPLQSFAGGRTQLQGVYMAVDGDAVASAAARELALLLGGQPFSVPAAERAAYHAAACICSNYTVALMALAQQLMERWTGSSAAAWQALLPLFEGTAANLRQTVNPAAVLTGPIARGDVQTVAGHVAALPPELLPVYCSLGLAAVQLALTNGTIDERAAQQLQELLQHREE